MYIISVAAFLTFEWNGIFEFQIIAFVFSVNYWIDTQELLDLM